MAAGLSRLVHAAAIVAAGCITACSPTAPSHDGSSAVVPGRTIRLFDRGSLSEFQTWLVDHHEADPAGVFSVVQADGAPAIRITGEIWGGIITRRAFRNYRLVAEFRWGGPTHGERAARTRDSGILLHAQGRLGNTSSDFNGPWLQSIEFQIIEGGVGDLILVSGFDEDGRRVRPVVTATTRKDRDGEDVYDPGGLPRTFTGGRVNWSRKDEDWMDRTGFRGREDVETANLGWTRVEAVADGSHFTYYVNGTLVNAATDATFDEGRIMIQSEGAEILIRRFDLEPLD
jgi:hypothetical protein